MEKIKLDRINELARQSKVRALTEDEKKEQAALRAEYIAEFRAQFTGILDNTYIQRPDGTKESVREKKKD